MTSNKFDLILNLNVPCETQIINGLYLSASSAPTSSIAASVAAKKAAKQPSGSPLREVAKKWRDAKTKLVLKGKITIILGWP